jgi:hypothetical protein
VENRQRHPLNVAGPFYVVEGCCAACGVPEAEAPELFAWDKTDHCYVRKQPSTPDELAHMVTTIATAELACIRYGGRDTDIIRSLKDKGEIKQCDHGE